MTTQSLINDIRSRYPTTASDSDLISRINKTMREIRADVAHREVWTSYMTPGVRQYALPGGINSSNIISITIGGVLQEYIHAEEELRANVYTFPADDVVLFERMPKTTLPMVIMYYAAAPDVVTGADEVDIDEQYVELIKLGVFITTAQAEGDVDLANNYLADYNALVAIARKGKWEKGSKFPHVKVRPIRRGA